MHVKFALSLATSLIAASAQAAPFSFSTGAPDGLIATATRPSSGAKLEIESADDFILGRTTQITSASFTGLLVGASISDIDSVIVEVYRVFPKDSNDPPSGNVPTRVNSPSDVAFDDRDVSGSFSAGVVSDSFTANNSVLNGIHPLPDVTTGGEGPVTGSEVTLDVTFDAPFSLPADHYFFVPQVGVAGDGNFFWLSAPKPITSPGTPFAPDLQSWIRNEALAPDWLRIGTDVDGQGTFNASFALTGLEVPLPAPGLLMLPVLGALAWAGRRRRAA